ncbi:transmembrane channel-like protein [Cydia amplana]|uniref:transmembrane channel-like protein n=1 Tax=Cydia amplana TaxID=1869771 RepID=UPI002FE68AFD
MVHAAPFLPLRWADLGTTRTYSYTMSLYDAPNPPRQQPRPVRPPLRAWRRFFPDSFFYDVHPRRFPKSPPTRLPGRPSTLATTTSRATIAQKTAITESPTKSTKNIKRTPSTSSSKVTSKSLRTSNGRTLRQRTSKKATFHKKTSTYIENTDPVEAEVASELLKEFKLINITPKSKIRKTATVGGSGTSTE